MPLYVIRKSGSVCTMMRRVIRSTSASVDFSMDMNIVGNTTDFNETKFKNNLAAALGNGVMPDNITLPQVLDLTPQNLPGSKRVKLKGRSGELEPEMHLTVVVKTDVAHSAGVSGQLQELANNVTLASEKVKEKVESEFLYPTFGISIASTTGVPGDATTAPH